MRLFVRATLFSNVCHLSILGMGTALAASCGGDNGTTPPPNSVPAIGSVEVPQPNAALSIGQTFQLDAVVRSTSGAIIAASIAWQSADPSIVQVSATGLATAVAPGTTSVTAAATNATTTSPVTGSTTVNVAVPTLLARRGHAMTFDIGRNRVLLYGGIGPLVTGGVANDQGSTWAFDGSHWSLVSLGASGPGGRNSTTFAYDQARDVSVVFGGRSGTAPNAPAFGDTWELSGTTWTQRAQGGPSARSHATSAFDPASQHVVLIGGIDPTTLDNFSDQWEWAGQSWTRAANVTPPTAGTFGGSVVADQTGALYLMLSRENDRRVLVYASIGGTWQLRDVPDAPVASAFAVARAPGGGVLLFGGATDAGVVGDSWLWNGGTWTKLNLPGPPARTGHAMAYDITRNRVVLYGGESAGQAFADTWEFDGSAWRQIP